MAKNDDGSRMLRCSFCGKTQDKVDKLIAGTGVCICNECVQLCNSVLEEEGLSSRRRAAREEAADITIPKPTQIKEVLDQYVRTRPKSRCQWRCIIIIKESFLEAMGMWS